MKKTRTMAYANIWCSVVFIVISIYAIVASTHFKEYRNSTVNPSAFPQIMATGLLICSLALLAMELVKLLQNKATEDAPILSIKDRGIRYALLCMLLAVLYVMLLNPLGFLIVAPVISLCMMHMIGLRKWSVMIIVSLVLALGIWLLFYKVLSISLPLGILEGIYDIF